MSAFVVNENTLSIIASYIETQLNVGFNNTGLDFDFNRNEFKSAYLGGFYQAKEIFNILLDENIKAVNGRYKSVNDTRETYINEYLYKYKPVYITRIKQNNTLYLKLFRALQCYCYQICEDATIDGYLYKTLSDLKNRIACSIVSDLADNVGAVWG